MTEIKLMALSLRQPYAEQVLSGEKKVEYRTVSTNKRERVWIYESKANGGRGLIVGSVEITDCEEPSKDEGKYQWHLASPERCEPWVPSGRPQPVFFNPGAMPRAVQAPTPIGPSLDEFLGKVKEGEQVDKQAVRILRIEDDLRIARAARDAADKRMHEAERLREQVFHLADTLIKQPDWMIERSKAGDAPHTPILVTSDFQFGEVIDKVNMDGINEYNVEIAQKRYRKLIDKTVDIAFSHLPKNRYDGIVLLRLGDTVSGDIHDELRRTNELSGVTSIPAVAEMEAWGVAQLAEAFKRVHVVSVPGNHGRTTLKPPSKRIEENYDWLASCFLEREFKGDNRMTWQTPRSTDAVFQVAGRKYLATHGDNIGTKGGMGFVGPIATISRGATLTMREYAARGVHIDKMFIGHFHSAFFFGRGWANGSLPGYSEYARAGRMTPENAQQWLLFMHQKYGCTSQWLIQL